MTQASILLASFFTPQLFSLRFVSILVFSSLSFFLFLGGVRQLQLDHRFLHVPTNYAYSFLFYHVFYVGHSVCFAYGASVGESFLVSFVGLFYIFFRFRRRISVVSLG